MRRFMSRVFPALREDLRTWRVLAGTDPRWRKVTAVDTVEAGKLVDGEVHAMREVGDE